MRDRYWATLETTIYTIFYYEHYSTWVNRVITWVNCFLMISSVVVISAWTKYEIIVKIWAALVLLSQIINAVKHFFPFTNQKVALDYLLPDLDFLKNDVERDWQKVDNLDDDKIADLVYKYENQLTTLKHKYIGCTPFPPSQKCQEKAQNDQLAYLQRCYQITKYERLEVKI